MSKSTSTPDKTPARNSSGFKVFALALLGAAAALGYYFRSCGAGWGTGIAPGVSESGSATVATKPQTVEIILISVKGETCTRAGEAARTCSAVCEDTKAKDAKTKRVEIDGAYGAHQVVETLRKCLVDGGFTNVTARAEPQAPAGAASQ